MMGYLIISAIISISFICIHLRTKRYDPMMMVFVILTIIACLVLDLFGYKEMVTNLSIVFFYPTLTFAIVLILDRLRTKPNEKNV